MRNVIPQRLSRGRCGGGAGEEGCWGLTGEVGEHISAGQAAPTELQQAHPLFPRNSSKPRQSAQGGRPAGQRSEEASRPIIETARLTRTSSSLRPRQLATFALSRLINKLGQMLPVEPVSSPSTPACSSKCQDAILTALFSWEEGHGRVLPDACRHDRRGMAAPGAAELGEPTVVS